MPAYRSSRERRTQCSTRARPTPRPRAGPHREHPELALVVPPDLAVRRTDRAERHRAEQLAVLDRDQDLGFPGPAGGVGQFRRVVVARVDVPVAEVGLCRQPADILELVGMDGSDLHVAGVASGQMPKVLRGYGALTSVITLTR